MPRKRLNRAGRLVATCENLGLLRVPTARNPFSAVGADPACRTDPIAFTGFYHVLHVGSRASESNAHRRSKFFVALHNVEPGSGSGEYPRHLGNRPPRVIKRRKYVGAGPMRH
jgi:hypothetical protein